MSAEKPKWRLDAERRLLAAGSALQVGSDLHLVEMAIKGLDRAAAELARLRGELSDLHAEVMGLRADLAALGR